MVLRLSQFSCHEREDRGLVVPETKLRRLMSTSRLRTLDAAAISGFDGPVTLKQHCCLVSKPLISSCGMNWTLSDTMASTPTN